MEEQLDLFAVAAAAADAPASPAEPLPRLEALSDAELIAALPYARVAAAPWLAAEAGRRKLAAAVPALEQLCLRLAGFGAAAPVPEQTAAIAGLATIGSEAARLSVARIISRRVVQGPNLAAALAAAAQLRAPLSTGLLDECLRHPDAAVRAGACRCARSGAVLLPLLGLLDDPDLAVAGAAACALGRLGHRKARPMLTALLRREPSAELIEALSCVADSDAIVLLARTARERPQLAPAIIDALDGIDDPIAVKAAAALRR